jgi:hypothetical protein
VEGLAQAVGTPLYLRANGTATKKGRPTRLWATPREKEEVENVQAVTSQLLNGSNPIRTKNRDPIEVKKLQVF